jgi:AcrR family transcriptional regulator
VSSTPATRPRTRLPRAARFEQILTVAEELFRERGFSGVSMDELARRVGVSKPVIYDLVGGKEQVFRTIVDRSARELTDRVVGALDGATSLRERLHRGALAFFEFVAEHRQAWAMLLSSAAAAEAVMEISESRRRQTVLVRDLLLEDSHGRLDAARAEAIAVAATGAFEAAATWWPEHPELSVETMADLTVGLLLPGIEAALAG